MLLWACSIFRQPVQPGIFEVLNAALGMPYIQASCAFCVLEVLHALPGMQHTQSVCRQSAVNLSICCQLEGTYSGNG